MKQPAIKKPSYPNLLGIRGWAYGGKYRIERYFYTLQRITGLGVLLYLPMHLIVTSQKLNQTSWDSVMGLVTRGILPWGEWLVFVGAVFHALNGLRLLATEFGFALRQPERPIYPFTLAAGRQRPIVYMVLLLSLIIVSYGTFELISVQH